MDYKDKSAFITGAARGIGKAYARILLQKGCKVCLADIDEEQGQTTCNELQTEFGKENAMFVKCDVARSDDLKAAFKEAVDNYKYIDIFINNAGLINEGQPERCVDVNLHGAVRGTKLAMEHMRQDKGGRGGTIVFMTSIAVFIPFNFIPVYASTKSAIFGYCKTYAAHPDVFKNGIRLVSLAPSGVDTPILNFKPEQLEGIELFEEVRKVMKMLSPTVVAEGLIKVLDDQDNNGKCLKIDYNEAGEIDMTYA